MKHKYLTEKERYQIEALLKRKHTVKEIAETLGKCQSTIYREIKLGTVMQWDSTSSKDYPHYLADVGQRVHDEKSHLKGAKLKYNDISFLHLVSDLLNKKYSPYAMLITLKENGYNVSEKTLYNYIHKRLIPHFTVSNMIMPRKERPKKSNDKRIARNHLYHRSIEERSKDVLTRNDFGHWELDTVESGKGDKTTLLCFTERMTRIELLFKVSGKTLDNTVKILNRIERKLTAPVFRETFKTITVDNGCEFVNPDMLEKSYINHKLKRTTFYYCHPYCSCERGSNENQNRFVRRFIPKGDYISMYSHDEIRCIQDFINAYPRRQFNGLSAYDRLLQCTFSVRTENIFD